MTRAHRLCIPLCGLVGLNLALVTAALAQDTADEDLPLDEAAVPVIPVPLVAPTLPEEIVDQEQPPAPPVASPSRLPNAPASDASDTFLPSFDMGRVFDGFSASLSMGSIYDSNVMHASGGPLDPIEDDFIFIANPTIAYSNPGTEWTISADAGLNYSSYMDDSELGGLGERASFGLAYEGAKSKLETKLAVAKEVGVSSTYNSSYVERQKLSFSLNGSYRVSRKTILDGTFGYSWEDPDRGFGGSSSLTTTVSAMWRFSPLLRLGPGLRYALQAGDIQADRENFGPIMRVDYRLSAKTSLDAETGLAFIRYGGSDGASDQFVHARVGASYAPSPLWDLNLSIFRDASADPTQVGAYREILSTRFGVTRKIGRFAFANGLTLEHEDRASATGVAIPGGTRDYLMFDTSLSTKLFRERVDASIFYRWRDESRTGSSWNGSQIGLSLSTKF